MPDGYILDGTYNKVDNLMELYGTEGKHYYDDSTKILTISLTDADLGSIIYVNDGSEKISAVAGWNKTSTMVDAGPVAEKTLIIVNP